MEHAFRDTRTTVRRARSAGAPALPPAHAFLLRLNHQAGNAAVAQRLAPVVQRAHATQQDAAGAVEELRERYPKLKITSTIEEADEPFWKRYLVRDGRPLTLAQLITSLLDPVLRDDLRTGVDVKLFATRSKGTCHGVQIQVHTAGAPGERFHLNQEYLVRDGKLTVHLENIEGKGGQGRDYIRGSLLPQAAQLGVTSIDLKAFTSGGQSGGVVAWARYGFVPTGTDWDAIRRHGLKLLAEPNHGVPDEGQLRAALLCPAPVSVRLLVYLAWRDGPATTDLVNRALSKYGSWDGALDLTDATSKAWITAYAANPPADQRLTIFQPLLPALTGQQPPPAEDEEVDESLSEWLVESVRTGTRRMGDVLWEFGAGVASRVRTLLDALNTG